MPASALHERLSDSVPESPPADTDCSATRPTSDAERPERGPPVSRRRLLAGFVTTATASLAGCAGRFPGNAATIDAAARTTEDTLVWEYPASAVEGDGDSDGIGYASIRFRVFDGAETDRSVAPVLTFQLNSTVGDVAAGESYQGYRADWFRFRLGVPRTYDDAAGLRAFVHPKQWPEIRTTYGYQNSRRDLVVHVPDVDEVGTITVEGRFRPTGATLPRQLYCGFEVQASQPRPLGRAVVADGRELFDLSTLDVPGGVALE